MKKNKVALLGLMGLLGLFGIPTGQYALFGFFGFFGFLGLLGSKNDELLEKNVGKAATNAYIVSILGLSITMVLVALLETVSAAMIGVAVTFVFQMLTFTFSLQVYENI